MADRDPGPLPGEVRARLAELELELSEGEYLAWSSVLGPARPGSDLMLGRHFGVLVEKPRGAFFFFFFSLFCFWCKKRRFK